MDIKILDPFNDGVEKLIGSEESDTIRQVFQLIDPESVYAKHMRAGLTIFEPGQSSSMHIHPDSEELNYIIRGSGIAKSGDKEQVFKANYFIHIPQILIITILTLVMSLCG